MSDTEPGLTLLSVRRMMEGIVPPSLCTASPDGMPSVNYLSLVEYVDPQHVALSYQFFNRSRQNVLATRRASLTLDDPTMKGLAELLLIDHAMVWLLDPARDCMVLLASRGYDTRGTGAEIPLGEGLAGIAAREGVPIRVGHMMNMQTYGRAARTRASELGLDAMLNQEIPLPGLPQPRSQLAVPLRARGHVLGVLFVESLHDQYFGYDDEDALMLLCGQLAVALTLLQSADAENATDTTDFAPPALAGPPLRLRRYVHDNSVFLDDQYLIRGMAGAILWKLASEFVDTGRCEFTNRELRLAPDLRLPDIQDNLEVRLVLLQRRLAEHRATIQIEKTGRGRFRFSAARPLAMEDVAK